MVLTAAERKNDLDLQKRNQGKAQNAISKNLKILTKGGGRKLPSSATNKQKRPKVKKPAILTTIASARPPITPFNRGGMQRTFQYGIGGVDNRGFSRLTGMNAKRDAQRKYDSDVKAANNAPTGYKLTSGRTIGGTVAAEKERQKRGQERLVRRNKKIASKKG